MTVYRDKNAKLREHTRPPGLGISVGGRWRLQHYDKKTSRVYADSYPKVRGTTLAPVLLEYCTILIARGMMSDVLSRSRIEYKT